MSNPLDGARWRHEGPQGTLLVMSALIPVMFSGMTSVLVYVLLPAIIQKKNFGLAEKALDTRARPSSRFCVLLHTSGSLKRTVTFDRL